VGQHDRNGGSTSSEFTIAKRLVGIDRFTIQMDNAGLTHKQYINSIKLIGAKLIPLMKAGSEGVITFYHHLISSTSITYTFICD
jgi:hypothetical protein